MRCADLQCSGNFYKTLRVLHALIFFFCWSTETCIQHQDVTTHAAAPKCCLLGVSYFPGYCAFHLLSHSANVNLNLPTLYTIEVVFFFLCTTLFCGLTRVMIPLHIFFRLNLRCEDVSAMFVYASVSSHNLDQRASRGIPHSLVC